jgi:hypothetical protein
MGIIENIKKSLYAKALANKINLFKQKRRFQGWDSVEVYNILFEENGFFPVEDVMKLTEKLRNKGKQVHLLCYLGSSTKTGLPYKTFNDKDISFNLVPKSNLVEEFTAKQVNIFYNLIPIEKEISEYISLTCKADFKIGLYDEHKSGLDLMINLKEPKLNEFIKTVENVLNNTYS